MYYNLLDYLSGQLELYRAYVSAEFCNHVTASWGNALFRIYSTLWSNGNKGNVINLFHDVSYIRTSEKLNQIQNRYLPSPQGKDNLLHFNCYVTRRIAAEKTQMVEWNYFSVLTIERETRNEIVLEILKNAYVSTYWKSIEISPTCDMKHRCIIV